MSKPELKRATVMNTLRTLRLALATIHWSALRLDRADREWTAGLGAMESALRNQPDDNPLRGELDNARPERVHAAGRIVPEQARPAQGHRVSMGGGLAGP